MKHRAFCCCNFLPTFVRNGDGKLNESWLSYRCFFVGFCFVLDFLYEQLQGLSIYQQNHQARIRSIQNISFFKLSVLN